MAVIKGGLNVHKNNRQSDADRLRQRLRKRYAQMNERTYMKISPFTILSVVIIFVMLFITR